MKNKKCKECEKLKASYEALLHQEHQLGGAYIRIRTLLKDYGSFNTPFAPSGEEVWYFTEEALKKLLKEKGK